MNPETVRLFVPFSAEAPWIVRGEASRVGTYPTRAEAISAAVRVRAKLVRAWGCNIRPCACRRATAAGASCLIRIRRLCCNR